MFANRLLITPKQNSHLVRTEPHGLILHTDINLCLSVLGLVYDDFVLFHDLIF